MTPEETGFAGLSRFALRYMGRSWHGKTVTLKSASTRAWTLE
jgi:hypothetical protein